MYTIDEIRNITFTRKMGAYKAQEVDEFIDGVVETLEQMSAENTENRSKLDTLASRLVEYRNDEENIHATMISAQRNADAQIQAAEDQAKQIVAEAEAKASEMIQSAQEQADTTLREAEEKSSAMIAESNDRVAKQQADTDESIRQQMIEFEKEKVFQENQIANLKNEAADFRKDLLAKYKEQVMLIDAIPSQRAELKDMPVYEAPVAAEPVVEETFEEPVFDTGFEMNAEPEFTEEVAAEPVAEEVIEEPVFENGFGDFATETTEDYVVPEEPAIDFAEAIDEDKTFDVTGSSDGMEFSFEPVAGQDVSFEPGFGAAEEVAAEPEISFEPAFGGVDEVTAEPGFSFEPVTNPEFSFNADEETDISFGPAFGAEADGSDVSFGPAFGSDDSDIQFGTPSGESDISFDVPNFNLDDIDASDNFQIESAMFPNSEDGGNGDFGELQFGQNYGDDSGMSNPFGANF